MALKKLSTNYQDDALSSEMNGLRQYQQINNANGTISLEDKTVYTTQGTELGAKELVDIVNTINGTIDAISKLRDAFSISGTVVTIDFDKLNEVI